MEDYALFIAGKANVVGRDGVQEEPIKSWEVPVHLKHTRKCKIQRYTTGVCVCSCTCYTMRTPGHAPG